MTSQQFHNLKSGDLVRSNRDGKTYIIRDRLGDESFSAAEAAGGIDPEKAGAFISRLVNVRTPSVWETVDPIPSVGA